MQEGLFNELERVTVAVSFLEEIRAKGKTKPKMQTVAIAHGLAFDPHIDGRLRLTPVGEARLELQTAA